MLNEREVSAAVGSTAYDADGDKIGTVEHFFADDRTGEPTWVAVSTGMFGTKHSVVPATGATFADGALRLPVRKEAVRDAPRPSEPDRLDPSTEAELRRHYGLAGGAQRDLPPRAQKPATEEGDGRPEAREDDSSPRAGTPGTGTVPGSSLRGSDEPPGPVPVPGREATAAGTGTGPDGAMTRSEERLRVSTERVATGRVRLVKYVVTEEVQVTVPIRREEVRLEEIPLGSEDSPAGAGSHLPPGTEPGAGLPEELVLHAERPVVGVEVVPVERVRVRTVTVSDQEQVSGRVQREQVVVDES